MLSGMTNCSSGAQACLPASTLQRHLKCLQPSTWFEKLWGFFWDPGSGFLGIILKIGWGRGQGRAGSDDGLTIPVCDGLKGLQAPGVPGCVLSCRMSVWV